MIHIEPVAYNTSGESLDLNDEDTTQYGLNNDATMVTGFLHVSSNNGIND